MDYYEQAQQQLEKETGRKWTRSEVKDYLLPYTYGHSSESFVSDKCQWCQNKDIDHNMFHNNCRASGYSSFKPIEEIHIKPLYDVEDLKEKFRNAEEHKGIMFPEPMDKNEFIDIRVGYSCIKNSKDLNTISVFGITKNHDLVLLKTIPNAEYGSFSIKECIDNWDKIKEEMKNESK